MSLALTLLAVLQAADAGMPTELPSLHYVGGLQAAIDATPNGGTVKVRPGVYGELLHLKKRKGLKLIADGLAVVTHPATEWLGWQSGSHPLPLLEIEDCSDLVIENLVFRRDVKAERDPFRATTVRVSSSQRVTFKHVFIGGGDGKALEAGTSDVSVVDSTLEAVQYGLAEGSSTVTVRGSSIDSKQVPVAVFTPGCPGKDFTITSSRLTGPNGVSICAGDFERLTGNTVEGPSWHFKDVPPQVTQALARNTFVPRGSDVPPPPGLVPWRPPVELLTAHLEDFAVLPPETEGFPPVGSDWFVCSKSGTSDWRLFPDGPTTAYTMPMPVALPACGVVGEVPSEGAPVRLLERRGAWLKLRPPQAYIETGPARVEQGFWLKADSVATPCQLVSGDARLWTSLWSAGPVEVIDAKRVSIRGGVDLCGSELQTLTIDVPPSLRPATKRSWKLVCTARPAPGACGAEP
jgi:hypothetical protein